MITFVAVAQLIGVGVLLWLFCELFLVIGVMALRVLLLGAVILLAWIALNFLWGIIK
jgi:hypothetical protein